MKRPMPTIMWLVCVLFTLCPAKSARAQTIEGPSPESTSPLSVQPYPGGHIAGPIIMNNGIVRPLVDLDLFQYSNLDEKAGSTFDTGNAKSNFGQITTRPKSNIEINKPRELQAEDFQVHEGELDHEPSLESEEESTPSLTTSPAKQNTIYSWIDKYGVKHFTNNIYSIPSEYSDLVINEE